MTYELILHDYGNLSYQVLSTSLEQSEAEEIADRLNFLMATAGRSDQFVAEVYEVEETVGDE